VRCAFRCVASIMIRSGLPPLCADAAFAEPFGCVQQAAHKTIYNRFPVLDHKHDRAHDPPVVHPRDPVRTGKIALDPTHLRLRHQNKSVMAKPPRLADESANSTLRKKFKMS
jgi:hypothetical protein